MENNKQVQENLESKSDTDIKSDTRPSVLVGIPRRGGIGYDEFWMNLITRLSEWNNHFDVNLRYENVYPLDKARTNIAEEALRLNVDYLFFVDSDTLVPQGGLERLYTHNLDIVSGVYGYKGTPFFPVVKKELAKNLYLPVVNYDEEWDKVDGIGLGCCLIKTDVLRKMKKQGAYPWFMNEWFKIPEVSYDSVIINEAIWETLSEDLNFCKKAKDLGYKINVDFNVHCSHMMISKVEFDDHLPFKQEYIEWENMRMKLMNELIEFTRLTKEDAWIKLRFGTKYVAEEYDKFGDKIYKESVNYIFDLANWHIFKRRKFDVNLVHKLKELTKDNTIKKPKILDFGCGIGQNAIMCAEAGFDVSMMDFNSKISKSAIFRAKKNNLNIPFYNVEDDKQINKLGGQFDIIFCYDVLEHVDDDKFENVINKLRMLRSGTGVVLITTNFGKTTEHPMHYNLTEEKQILINGLVEEQEDSKYNI